MDFIIENTNIMDELLPERVKEIIDKSDIDLSKEYDIEIKFDEDIIKSNEMFNYFINVVPKKKFMENDKKYRNIRSNLDCKEYAGDVLSYIFENIKSGMSKDIKICDSKIVGGMFCKSSEIHFVINETTKEKPKKGKMIKVCSIMPSETGFLNNIMNFVEEMKKREEHETKMLKMREKNQAKLALQRKTEIEDNKLKLSVEDIACQLGVSTEKLQEFINNEKIK